MPHGCYAHTGTLYSQTTTHTLMSQHMVTTLEILRQSQHLLVLKTQNQGLYELTSDILAWTDKQKFVTGLLTVYCRHTSASIIIQENADSAVIEDLQAFFAKLVPEDGKSYLHSAEGPDDMPAHIKGALTSTSISIPVTNGRPALGTWQGIYLFEHRHDPHTRQIVLHLSGS